MPRLPSFPLTLAVLGLALINGGCDRQSQPSAQPAGKEVAKAATGNVPAATPDRNQAGSRIPDFTFSDPKGARLRLPELEGKPVLLNLWATWCAPCVKEMPLLDSLAAEMSDKLKVVTISQDMQGAAKVTPFFAERKFAYLEPWLDSENDLAFHYGGASLPMTILYNSEGREIWRIAGDFDWSGAKAKSLVAEAFSK